MPSEKDRVGDRLLGYFRVTAKIDDLSGKKGEPLLDSVPDNAWREPAIQ